METIIVTTDQSANSKSAIRFAINMARTRKAKLVVLHVYHVLRPSIWSENAYQVYKHSFVNQIRKEITVFIKKIVRSLNLSDMSFELITIDHTDVTEGILKFTAQHPCDYICISTRGAGTVKKIFGTHSSKLITHSRVPVICIPSGYRNRPCKRVLYATDMNDYETEFSRLIDFVKPFNAKLRMLHVASSNEFVADSVLAEKRIQEKLSYKVEVINREWNISHPILKDIGAEVKRYKPSLIAFFTHQKRSFLAQLVLPSNAAEYSFYGRVPMISFKKE
ncbi:universal stress protein [Pedobacter polysacchareus]|uniref:universal stress protein n=1 Tax=Pedobacter polysacchareus TaxID=2861973 RepID=UPI001C99D164|nr:universal stress protein [Pedobacter polysacchareus]